MSYIWFNGELVSSNAARISPLDHGFTVGDGVFESLVAYSGRVFALRRHYERLLVGAAALGLTAPSLEELRTAIATLLAAEGREQGRGGDSRIRITLTGGEGPLGSDQGHGQPSCVIAVSDPPRRSEIAPVAVVPWTRNESGALCGVKSTSYAENVRALALAKSRGAQEAIFGNTRGELCEGSGSNVFLVAESESVLVTPPLESGCLAGVTRQIVLELCAAEGIPFRQTTVPLAWLETAREAFLTSTFREVQAIGQVDGSTLPAAPGPKTRKLQAAFASYKQRAGLDF